MTTKRYLDWINIIFIIFIGIATTSLFIDGLDELIKAFKYKGYRDWVEIYSKIAAGSIGLIFSVHYLVNIYKKIKLNISPNRQLMISSVINTIMLLIPIGGIIASFADSSGWCTQCLFFYIAFRYLSIPLFLLSYFYYLKGMKIIKANKESGASPLTVPHL